jgi:diguanylate cyclase (GGDEF)-like protein
VLSVRSAGARIRRTSLLVRFAVVSLVLVVGLGVLLAQLLSSMIARRGLQSATDAARLTTTIAIRPLLTEGDLANGIPAEKVAALDRALHGSQGAGTEIARVKIWHNDGDLLYVADPHTVAAGPPDATPSDELEEAFAGEVEAEIISSSEEPDNAPLLERYGTLLEVYVPIEYAGDPRPAGVFELYLPYRPVQASIRADTWRAIGLLGLGLVVLWLGLFRTVATASRRLRQESARNEHQALHDGLTGLANRRRLDMELAAAVTNRRTSALVLLDLDRFREVNDTLGHSAGDDLVREMAARLTALAGPEDVVARLGGDEFAVLLPDVPDLESAMLHAETLRGALAAPVAVGGVDVALDARAGLSMCPLDASDGPTMLQHADVAAETAKRTHAGLCAYEAATDQHSAQRLGLLADLARALSNGELVLHYQPKCTVDGVVLGVEALVRWQHPHRGLVAPLEFVPVAERTGLIHPLTETVLDQALAQARAWLDAGRPLPVAVNVSTRSLLHPGFAEQVMTALGTHGVPAELLGLEITETAIMEDPDRALEVLSRLAEAGVRLAIDDFGTGYSSLAYLNALPVHELKIDRAFVTELTTSERDRVIVDSTIALGNRLGLDVVAEGVEDPETLDALTRLGCRTVQGFLFSRPVPADRISLAGPLPHSASTDALSGPSTLTSGRESLPIA